jgi:hypothetical protein
MRQHADEYVCYVCGAPAVPQQWSSEVFAHYIDLHRCAGCDRSVCDELHTRLIDEDVVISRAGLRSYRYHVTRRYCDLCARLRRFGGLIGAMRWLVATVGMLLAGIFIYFEILR